MQFMTVSGGLRIRNSIRRICVIWVLTGVGQAAAVSADGEIDPAHRRSQGDHLHDHGIVR